MTQTVISLYHYLQAHRRVCALSLLAVTLILTALVTRLNYKEDISAFLPLDSRNQEAMQVWQDISGANKLFAIFQHTDTTKADADRLVAAIDRFTEQVAAQDTAHLVGNVTARVDIEQMTEVADFVYTNIPYFLTSADYARMDTLLTQDSFASQQLQKDKQLLMFPSGGLLTDNIGRDPLNLFTPVVERLRGTSPQMAYETHDGCIFTPDMKHAVVIIDSPFGSSETEHNGRIVQLLQACADSTTAVMSDVEVHLTGGPVIAVGNATQIKADSALSVTLAVVLILALLLVTLRGVRNLMLIAVSIAWGWLFAMGGLALVHNEVSIIVLGISSVILGIAVNYPLHFLAHLSHTPDKRQALREIVAPLLVGNVTTVGAFLALVPLRSSALRDLGLFASFLLVGTIVFVLLYLPHLAKAQTRPQRPTVLDRVGETRLENKRWLVVTVVVLTCVFGWFSKDAGFDTNMNHINYMTDEQRADMELFQQTLSQNDGTGTVYAVSSGRTLDEALNQSLRKQATFGCLKDSGLITEAHGCTQFLTSEAEQARRLQQWNAFLCRHRDALTKTVREAGAAEGFAQDSFDEFFDILNAHYTPQTQSYFAPLAQTAFAQNLSTDSVQGRYSVVDVLTTAPSNINKVEAQLEQAGGYTFDVASMNSAIARHLSDDFNYIGWACGCIVFLFLWLSMGSLELAILSFIPMAVSWVWILGIMGLTGLQFNIVNVILATFIFGQGDDYTIFMTEGACYEYAYRRRMLASYKHSIIISALIMFIGIGTLIVARHPALRSLAQLTIAGMFSVVLMAYIFPPLIFRWLVMKDGRYRTRPLSLSLLWERIITRRQPLSQEEACRRLVRDRYRYKGVDVCRAVRHGLKASMPEPEQRDGKTIFANSGYGEQALLYALLHPADTVVAIEADEDKATVARWAADGLADNFHATCNSESPLA